MISAIAADLPVTADTSRGHRRPPAPHKMTSRPETKDYTKALEEDRATLAAQPESPTIPAAANFAASVLSGALPPVPETMEELVRRIGSSPIPVESQARLKDLLV
ncbi:MAG TPA: hypothetical protein VIL88_00050 [Devosia sp.]|jgi:hypothetical protein|uniref:hypothetical protein n=1 Tax=Devosia sp. TaxID=1871048 RepID=UPI002F929416